MIKLTVEEYTNLIQENTKLRALENAVYNNLVLNYSGRALRLSDDDNEIANVYRNICPRSYLTKFEKEFEKEKNKAAENAAENTEV